MIPQSMAGALYRYRQIHVKGDTVVDLTLVASRAVHVPIDTPAVILLGNNNNNKSRDVLVRARWSGSNGRPTIFNEVRRYVTRQEAADDKSCAEL